MIDRSEIMPDVALQDKFVFAAIFRETVNRFMAALVFSAGVGVVNKSIIENGFDDIAEGMLEDPVPVRQSADQSLFRVKDIKLFVAAESICLVSQFRLEGQKFIFNIKIEFADLALKFFAPLGFFGGPQ